MKTIWKYQLELADEQVITLPNDSEILYIATQYDIPCIWAMVNPNPGAPVKKVKIIMRGTGRPLPDEELKYLGSCQLDDGRLIFHVFEEVK